MKRLQDYLSAAREFEAAGEIDEALSLYRQRQQHVHAGDLLRRMGEDELAVAEYTQAADLLVANGNAYQQAGELMMNNAQRPDLAEGYFTAGWKSRPSGSALPCARRLAQLHAHNANCRSLMLLTEEAQDHLQAPGNEIGAAEFCNEVVRLAELPALAPIQEALRDRCLMTLAHKLRQSSHGSVQLVSQLFGPGSVWDAPLVGDAHFAVRTAQEGVKPRSADAHLTNTVIQALRPIVRSVCHATESGEVFLGFESGEIACFHPRRGDVQFLPAQLGPVYGLAVDAAGSNLTALSAGKDCPHLSCCTRPGQWGQWQLVETQPLNCHDYRLCPMLARTRDPVAGLIDRTRKELQLFRLPRLLPEESIDLQGHYPLTGILLRFSERHSPAISEPFASCLIFDGREMRYVTPLHGRKNLTQGILCAIPANRDSSSLDTTPLSWMFKGPGRLEVVGIGAEGVLTWLDLEFQSRDLITSINKSKAGSFRAAALIRCGVIAAVSNDSIVWLRAGANGITEQARQRLSLPDVVACFPNKDTLELIIISGDGTVARVRQTV